MRIKCGSIHDKLAEDGAGCMERSDMNSVLVVRLVVFEPFEFFPEGFCVSSRNWTPRRASIFGCLPMLWLPVGGGGIKGGGGYEYLDRAEKLDLVPPGSQLTDMAECKLGGFADIVAGYWRGV